MKKRITFSAFRLLRTHALIVIVLLSSGHSIYGQEQTSTNDVRSAINTVKDKSKEATMYAERAYNSMSFKDVKINAKQAAALLDEAKKIVSEASKSLASIGSNNNLKYETAIRNISHQIEDLQNKVNWAQLKSSEAAEINELEEAKHLSNKALNELKRVDKVAIEIQEELTKAEQALTNID